MLKTVILMSKVEPIIRVNCEDLNGVPSTATLTTRGARVGVEKGRYPREDIDNHRGIVLLS